MFLLNHWVNLISMRSVRGGTGETVIDDLELRKYTPQKSQKVLNEDTVRKVELGLEIRISDAVLVLLYFIASFTIKVLFSRILYH